MSPEQGRAVEMLGHAIDYLCDEFALECLRARVHEIVGMHPQIEAIQMLKERNRQIYLSCPEVPTLRERSQEWRRKLGHACLTTFGLTESQDCEPSIQGK
jgi:hypothetical protein